MKEPTPHLSAGIGAKEKNGCVGLCVDLRELNKASVVDSHALRRVELVFHAFKGATVFSTIDVYHQVRFHKDSRGLTAFIIHTGLLLFSKVP